MDKEGEWPIERYIRYEVTVVEISWEVCFRTQTLND